VTFVRHDTSSNAGNMLVLRDPEGWEYWYMHINNDTPGTDDGRNERRWAFVGGIEEGARVVEGQHLGFVGDSGNAERTQPHLHFEIHRPGGEVVNPYESLVGAPHVSAALGRALALHPERGHYVLTSNGSVHAFDGAPHFGNASLFGAARALAVMPDGRGYTVLDGFGGLHHFGSASRLRGLSGPYWPGQDLAKDLAITPSGGGFALLDAYGAVHVRGDAPRPPATYWPGWDIARGVAITPSGRGIYVLDGFGGVSGSGDAAPGGTAYFPGSDRVRGIAASGSGYAVITAKGRVYATADARRSNRSTPGEGWRALDTRGDRLVALRGDALHVVL
ncbi:MAG: M23 family metallopeptidase, partial [Acidimicrobiia bacterium]|nr:M23 family metallopeptidase [Acidimicrobiia bacterium]